MLTEEQKETYYQNIRSIIMVKNGYGHQDIDNEEVEDFVNREADHIFETIFEEEYKLNK
jgi:hypothetical protein|tara:strand:+ start:1180 stop:1356 length:177 start_codon:yes stop_codon:yes gene_type:complete